MLQRQPTSDDRQAAASQFETMREPVAQLTRSLLRVIERAEGRQQIIAEALTEFHRTVPSGLEMDAHNNLPRADFLLAVVPAQILYKAGLFVEAITYSQKAGSSGHYITQTLAAELHKTAASILNNWYVGYHQQNIWNVADPAVDGLDAFASMGMADPVLETIDGILTGRPEHSAYSDPDTVQRAHLSEWKGRLAKRSVGSEQSALLRGDPNAAWTAFVNGVLGK